MALSSRGTPTPVAGQLESLSSWKSNSSFAYSASSRITACEVNCTGRAIWVKKRFGSNGDRDAGAENSEGRVVALGTSYAGHESWEACPNFEGPSGAAVMHSRTLLYSLLAVAAALAVIPAVRGGPVPAKELYEGHVVRTGEATLALADHDQQQVTLDVAPDALITRDGAEVPLKRLQMGDDVQVMTEARDGKIRAVAIVATVPY
jgi:hypothetical protein